MEGFSSGPFTTGCSPLGTGDNEDRTGNAQMVSISGPGHGNDGPWGLFLCPCDGKPSRTLRDCEDQGDLGCLIQPLRFSRSCLPAAMKAFLLKLLL